MLNGWVRGERGLMMHLLAHKHKRGKITEEKSEIAVASRMNEQERVRCIESEITEAILEEIVEKRTVGIEERSRLGW